MSNDLIAKADNPALVVFKAVAQPRTYSDVIPCPSPKFLPYAKEHGEEALIAVVIIVLSRITEALAYEVRPVMITEAARTIIADWPDTKLSDLLLFKSEVIAGRVGGKLYRWDARVIVETWREYYENRENEFAEARERRWAEQKRKEGEPDPVQPSGSLDELKKQYQANMKKLAEKGAEDRKKWEAEKTHRNMSLEELCNFYAISYQDVEKAIEHNCIQEMNAGQVPEENREAFRQFYFKRVLFEAKKDINYLSHYVNL